MKWGKICFQMASTENVSISFIINEWKVGEKIIMSRASVKRTYDIYYALRLPPDVQIELQRRTTDFRNFFCLSEIDTEDVKKLSKGPPTFNQLFAPPTYRKFATCVDWA